MDRRWRVIRETRAIVRRAATEPVTLLVTLLAFAAAGSLFVASALTSRGTDLRAEQAGDLRTLIERRADQITALEAQVAELRTDVTDLTSRYNAPALSESLARAEALAPRVGLTQANGPALRVTLDDSRGSSRDVAIAQGATPDDLVVHQQDVQAVVNALWRGGATAMEIMDQRILTTSAVRCVGNTLILKGRVYSPPFVITAVGDITAMTTSLDNDFGVQTYREFVSLYGLGYRVESLQEHTAAPWEGSIQLRFARVMDN